MKKLRWEINDWIWLVSLLIIIILYLATRKLAQNENLTNYISFASSSISIALAFIAIFISVIQNDSSSKLNNEMQVTLAKLNQKVDLANDRMESIEKDLYEFYHNFSEQIDNSLSKEDATKVKSALQSELQRINLLDQKTDFLQKYLYSNK